MVRLCRLSGGDDMRVSPLGIYTDQAEPRSRGAAAAVLAILVAAHEPLTPAQVIAEAARRGLPWTSDVVRWTLRQLRRKGQVLTEGRGTRAGYRYRLAR
jgi:hypothetical protein